MTMTLVEWIPSTKFFERQEDFPPNYIGFTINRGKTLFQTLVKGKSTLCFRAIGTKNGKRITRVVEREHLLGLQYNV